MVSIKNFNTILYGNITNIKLLICLISNVTLILSLYTNAMSFIFPISLVLSVLPGLFFILKKGKISNIDVFIIFLPLIVTRYIFSIRLGLPSGYDDVHTHIIWAENSIFNGSINFLYLDRVSSNFVGLYIFYNMAKLITSVNIPFLAISLHPLINIVSFLVFYKFVNLFTDKKIALISLVIFGWEPIIFDFGEFRTQSFSLIFLLTFFYFIIKNKYDFNMKTSFLSIILIIGIITTSFVTPFIFLICLSTIIIGNSISRKIIKTKENELFVISKLYLIILIITFIGYMAYIGASFGDLTQILIQLFKNTFLFKYSRPNILSSIYVDFGIGSFFVQWMVKIIIFFLTMILFIYQIYYKKNVALPILVFCLGFLVSLSLFGSFELGANRIYYFFIIFASVTTAKGFEVIEKKLSSYYFKFFKIFFFTLILFFAIYSIIRLPNYIIGNTFPFRSNSNIDTIRYWDVTNKDVNTGKFLNQFGSNKFTVFYNVIPIYCYYYPYTQTISFENELSLNNFNNNLIIFLHDKYNGNSYLYRDRFPSIKDLIKINLIFQNSDMFLFYR